MQVNLGSIRQWHWISSAGCLIGMLLFAITGITLNHAAEIKVQPTVSVLEVAIPENLNQKLKSTEQKNRHTTVPNSLRFWLAETKGIQLSKNAVAEWSDDELYIVHAGPGFDAWLAIDFTTNVLSYESTDRGWLAYFNDLHKGRDTGLIWGRFLDVFSAACVVFCITGLVLLYRQTNHRLMTWPVTALGAIIPTVILLLFVH